jgi:DNA primase
VTEGYTDVIACHQAGVSNVVATLGTALTVEHARTLSRLCETVVLLFDGDRAGMKAADRALEVFFAEPVDVKIAVLPGGLDPDELLRMPTGRETLERVVASAKEALGYSVDRFRAELGAAASATARATRLERFIDQLAALGFGRLQGPRRRLVSVQLAHLLDLPLSHIEQAMAQAVTRAARRPAAASSSAAPAGSSETILASEGAADAVIELPPALRRAERDLLAVLVFEPALMHETMEVQGGSRAAMRDALAATTLRDPALRAVYQLLHEASASHEEPTVQQLLGRADSAELRRLIGDLYEAGRRRCGSESAAALHELHIAATALAELDRQARYQRGLDAAKRQPPTAVPILADIVEQRRRHGNNPLAMPRGIRS